MTTIAQAVRSVSANVEHATRAGEFASLVKTILAHGSISKAANAIEVRGNREIGGSERLASIIVGAGGVGEVIGKAAVPAMTASALADYSPISGGFINSLVNAGAFDTMLGAMTPLPLGTATVGAISVGAQAFSVSEGSAKPITRLTIVNQQMNPLKAHALLVITRELARSAAPGSVQLIQRALRDAVAVLTDGAFLVAITTGLSAATSWGSTAEAVRADIAAMLRQISTGQGSRLFIITTPDIVANWSMLTDSKGVSAFPDLTPTGGLLQGMTVIPSDGVTSGQVILADASGLGGNAGEVALQSADESSLQFEGATPDSPPTASTNFISLWQSNHSGLRVERFFTAVKLRSDAVALCSNPNSYASGNSPP